LICERACFDACFDVQKRESLFWYLFWCTRERELVLLHDITSLLFRATSLA